MNEVKIKPGLVSFGRRVPQPHKDRAAERKLIIERRKYLDNLIASGLHATGAELDAQFKRLQDLNASTTTSAISPDAMATLTALDDEEDDRALQTELEEESKSPQFDADAVEAFQTGNIMGQTDQNFN